MEVILDANILFRTLISHGGIISIFFDSKLRLYAPEKLRDEFLNNKEEILSKSSLSEEDFEELAALLFETISFISAAEYAEFIPSAARLLDSHAKDVDFVALSLMKECKIWTYESRLFSLGLGISTKEISDNLKSDSGKYEDKEP